MTKISLGLIPSVLLLSGCLSFAENPLRDSLDKFMMGEISPQKVESAIQGLCLSSGPEIYKSTDRQGFCFATFSDGSNGQQVLFEGGPLKTVGFVLNPLIENSNIVCGPGQAKLEISENSFFYMDETFFQEHGGDKWRWSWLVSPKVRNEDSNFPFKKIQGFCVGKEKK
jgi:hypothetical protein